jgi:LysM repeat protein
MNDQDDTRRAEGGEPPAGPGGPEGPEPTGGPEAPESAGGLESPEPTAGPDDALRSLERLEELTRGESPPSTPPASLPSRRKRPRLAAVPRPTQGWARIAAPAAFLVAVIVVVSVAFQSGVVGGDDGAKAVKPAAKVTKSATKSPKPGSSTKATTKASAKPTTTSSASGDTRTYKIKPGDTLSGIAARFNTSVSEIEALNADTDLTTLQPGEKLIVPAQ